MIFSSDVMEPFCNYEDSVSNALHHALREPLVVRELAPSCILRHNLNALPPR